LSGRGKELILNDRIEDEKRLELSRMRPLGRKEEATPRREKALRRRVSWEEISTFREEVVQLYRRFERDITTLCEKHDVEIDFWYSPSAIQQPRFIVDGFVLDADQLYDEEEFNLLATSIKNKRHRLEREGVR